ncbi:MAG: PAS domain S-box protein [Planctomycetes bacterium]|nr:PAS domain S-box protein [Planctomycetota bacterium]
MPIDERTPGIKKPPVPAVVDISGRSLPSLKASHDLLRVTLTSIGDGVITTDASSRVTFLNPVAQRLTGWTQADALGLPMESVFHIINESTRQTVESPIARALKAGVAVGLANHTILVAKDGSETTIEDSAAPVRDEKGIVTGAVLVFRDVSERRRQERRADETLAYAQGILDTLRHGFLVLDGKLRVKSANAAFYRKFQVAEKDTVNRLVYELGGGEWNIPRLRTLLEEIIPNNNAFEDFEVEHDFPQLGRRILMLNARRLKNEEAGERILMVIEDVTDRRAADQALRDSEIRFRRLFQFAKDGIMILDANTGKIIDANSFMCGLLGQELTELAGKELYQIGLFKDVEENKAMFEKLRKEGYVRYDHLPVQTPGGKSTSVEFVSNVYAEDHRLVAQCNVRDISDRVRLEEQVKAQAAALADQSRRKDEFLAMLSHELRNPLAPILSATHLLKLQENSIENPVQQQSREVIERQVANLTRIVSDLLEVSRVVSGHIQLRIETVDFCQIVRHAHEAAGPLFARRQQKVSLALPKDPVWVNGDATRLEQIVMNLLDNAIKYTDEGGQIALELEGSHGRAGLHVRDSGIGIAAELLPCVFDLFMQADRSLDRVQGGLGLGLNLVQRLTKMQGGTVEAHSEGSGKGSEFVVWLPVVAGPVIVAKSPVTDPVAPPGELLRVLVVDDNVDACNMLTMLLEQRGHTVQKAYTGLVALESALSGRPDVILLDIGLPGMNGYEIARRLRQNPAMKNTRLVALTGYGTSEDVVLAREAGFDAHLLKPVDLSEVEKLLKAPNR